MITARQIFGHFWASSHLFKVWGLGVATDGWHTTVSNDLGTFARVFHIKIYLLPLLISLHVPFWVGEYKSGQIINGPDKISIKI